MMSYDFDPEFASPSQYANMYRNFGLQVVPAHAPDMRNPGSNFKRPLLSTWEEFQETLVPDRTFERWYGPAGDYRNNPQMGMLTGRCSGNVGVVDLDTHKNPQAAAWWQGLLASHNLSMEIETPEQRTGGGGLQKLFRFPSGYIIPTNKTGIGVDIRGQGGFAMLPPSKHASSKDYDWLLGCGPHEVEIAEAPDWLVDAIEELVEQHGGTTAGKKSEKTESTGAAYDDFGNQVDDRETKATKIIWAVILGMRRKDPDIRAHDTAAEFESAWQTYLRKVKSRLTVEGAKEDLLEREGRGLTMFRIKWRHAMKKWDKKVADAAAEEPPDEDPRPNDTSGNANDKPNIFEKVADLRQLPAPTWLVEKWIEAGATGIFYGKWAAGKSFIGFDLALHFAYGMPDWHGARLPGRDAQVLVIAREGHSGFVKRIDAFKKHHGLIDDPEPITFMRRSVSFMDDGQFGGLCADIKALGVKFELVIIDTVARVTAGQDINETEVVTVFMERCKTLGEITAAATIGVHHQNKAGTMMGSVYFEANADFVFEVTREGDEGPLETGSIKCTKQKEGDDGWSRSIAYKKVVLNQLTEEGSLVVSEIGDTPKKQAAKVSDENISFLIDEIRKRWDDREPFAVGVQSKRLTLENFVIRHIQVARKVAKNLINDLVTSEAIRVETYDAKRKLDGWRVHKWAR